MKTMKRKTKSLDCLYTASAFGRLNRRRYDECESTLRRTKSLENIHMHVSPAWFASKRPTRSQSLECLVNSSRAPCKRRHDVALPDDEEETACYSSPTNFRPMNSKLARRSRTLIDDHNLPTSISSGFFGTLMKFEKNRLRTFKNWPLDYMTPGELAKAGFYYLLTSDLVRCFECKITLFKWELGDRAILEHYKNNPKCPLINGYDVGNVPIDRKPLDVLQDFIDLDEFQPVMPNEDPVCSFGYLSSDQELEELDEDAQIFDRERIVHQDSRTEENAPQSFSEDQLFELMRSEEMRLKTFDTWPRHLVDLVKPADLARCGYFFTTIKDKVICAFCKVPTWNWEATDVPIKEHYKHNQDCPLLNDQECGNQPIKPVLFKELLLEFSDIAPSCSSYSDEDEVSFFLSRPESFERQLSSDSCSSQRTPPISNETLNELNKYKDLSKLFLAHKSVDKYYTFEDRLKTFDKWPLQQMNKNRLADAGFYFLEYNDQVKCFSCDLVLSNWSISDDPWIEHCKYSSNCEYLILQKGNEFITRNAKSKNSPKIEVVCSGSTASSGSSSSSSDIENEGQFIEEELFKNVCKICMIKEADVVYLPCSHLASCASCTIAMKDCPLCKQKILSTMKIYIS